MPRLPGRQRILGAWLLTCSAFGVEIPVDGYPPVSDPDDLGERSAIIVFLKEHGIAYEPGVDDAALLALYRAYWDAQRPAPKEDPPPAAPAPRVGPTADEIDRDNLILVLRREYRFTATDGKSLAELQEIHDRLRRAADADPAAGDRDRAPTATAAPVEPTPAAKPSPTAVEPKAAPAKAAPTPAVADAPAEPLPRIDSPALTPGHPRNRALRPLPELIEASKAGDTLAYLLIARAYAYGIGAPMDLDLAQKAFINSCSGAHGAELMIDAIERSDDEIAAYFLAQYIDNEKTTINGVLYDHSRRLALLQKAADGGCPHAYFALSRWSDWREPGSHPDIIRDRSRYLLLAAVGGSLQAIEEVLADPSAPRAHKPRLARLAIGILATDPDFRRKHQTLERMVEIVDYVRDPAATLALEQAGAVAGSRACQWKVAHHYTRIPNAKRTAEQDALMRFWLGAAALRGDLKSMLALAEALHQTRFDPPPPLVPYKWLVRANAGQRPTGYWEPYCQGLSEADMDLASRDALAWIPTADGTPLELPATVTIEPLPDLASWATLSP